MADPGWTNPDQWPQLIADWANYACPVAWTFRHTGDEQLAEDLLQEALAFHETVLPGVIEHADNWKPDICHAMAGNTEKTLTSLETQMDHNHLFWWRQHDRLAVYDQIRHEPRYQALMAEFERRITEQRERVEQMNLGAGP